MGQGKLPVKSPRAKLTLWCIRKECKQAGPVDSGRGSSRALGRAPNFGEAGCVLWGKKQKKREVSLFNASAVGDTLR